MKKNLATRTRILILWALFNLCCSSAYLYLINLPTNGKGIYFCLLINSTFRASTINGIGIIALCGWGLFLFYLIQIYFRKKRGTIRPFKI